MPVPGGFANIVRALGHRNFGIYVAGNILSLSGNWLQRLAVGWLTWELTHSPAWLGLVVFADLFPSVLVAPIAGAAADRWDRLALLKVTHRAAGVVSLAIASLTAAGLITVGILAVLTACLGLCLGFSQATRLALVPNLVPREDLKTALAINALTFNMARFVGAALAGFLIAWVSVAAAFFVVTASFALFLVALHMMRPEEAHADARPPGPSPAQQPSLLADAAAGLTYVAGHRGIGPVLLNLCVLSVCIRPLVELLPGFVEAIFASGAGGLSILTAAIGCGAITNGLYLAQRQSSDGLVAYVVANTALLCATAIAFMASPELAEIASRQSGLEITAFQMSIPFAVLAGFSMLGTAVGTQTLVQLAVDPAMRGRTLSLYALIIRGAPAAGSLIMGGAADILEAGMPLQIALRLPILAGVAIAACFLVRLFLVHVAVDRALAGAERATAKAAGGG